VNWPIHASVRAHDDVIRPIHAGVTAATDVIRPNDAGAGAYAGVRGATAGIIPEK
jgi:hypothetical protein